MSPAEPHTLIALLRRAAAAHPDRDILVFPDERVSYAEFLGRVEIAQRALVGLGVRPGDNVGVLMQNCPDHLVLLFAVSSLGAVEVPINTRNRASELAHVVADSGMRLVFTSTLGQEIADLPGRLAEGLAALPDAAGVRVVQLEGGPGRGLVSSAEVAAAADAGDPATAREWEDALTGEADAIMIYTSGTTSFAKGCPLRNGQLLSISRQTGERWGTRDGDRAWDALPFFHMSSILPFLACVHVAGTFISGPVFAAAEAIRMMREEHATLAWPAFGTVWQEILTHPSFTADAVSEVRSALAVAPPETTRMMERSAPHIALLSCYGITEGLGVPVMVRFDDDRETRTGTGGLPFEGIEVEIRDPETRAPLPAGERGSIWLRGENVFHGYWNDPVRTAEAFDDDGWFDTGDLGDMDERGVIRYLGRVKDMLKVGGENVAAIEIEEHLSTHPAVKLAAVVGAPDAKYGEIPVAYLELRAGATATEQEIIDFCRGAIASFKVPRHVRFVTEWPMSATKVRKVDLRDRIAAELAG